MNKKMRWSILLLLCYGAALLTIGLLTVFIDPYFHYHPPFAGISYSLQNERYQNDGILRHFDYNAIITGTSMTENFKTSECDSLFGAQSVKVPCSGASYREISEILEHAFSYNDEIRMVIRSLDGYRILEDKDALYYDSYPTYLSDDNFFNDIPYLLNKEILFNDTLGVVLRTLRHEQPTSFDDYSNWSSLFPYGKEAILATYSRPEKASSAQHLSESEKSVIRENLSQNIISQAVSHPNTDFYLFIPPYSVFWWDDLNQRGQLLKQIEIYRYASDLLVDYDNIYLFSFDDLFDVTTNPDFYKDGHHYGENINTMILELMAQEKHRLTRENLNAHWDEAEAFYSSYDYDSLFA